MLEKPDLPLDGKPQTVVEFLLEETDDGQTIVTSRETGFASLSPADRDRALPLNEGGSPSFYNTLKRYLEA